MLSLHLYSPGGFYERLFVTGSLAKGFHFSSLRKYVPLKVEWKSFCSVLCSGGVDKLDGLDLSTLGQFEGLWVKHQKDAKDKAISKLGPTPWLTLRFDSNTQHVGTRIQTDSEAPLLEAGKDTSLNWRDSVDLWPFPDSSLVGNPSVWFSISQELEPRASLYLCTIPQYKKSESCFRQKSTGACWWKWRQLSGILGKGMLRRPNKTGQIKGLRSHRASKGNRQQAFQADTQRNSEYKLWQRKTPTTRSELVVPYC